MAISTTFVANKKRLICWILKTSSSCHFTLSDIMDGLNRMIGVSSSSDASFHMDHVMRAESGQCCVFLPLCAPPCWSPRWPEGPSPQAGVAPAGTAEPLAREGGMDGWMERGGGYTDLENTVNSPQPPPSPSTPSCPPILCPYLPSPTYRQTLLLLYVCVYVCVHLSFISIRASLVDGRVRKKGRLCMCVCLWLCLKDF